MPAVRSALPEPRRRHRRPSLAVSSPAPRQWPDRPCRRWLRLRSFGPLCETLSHMLELVNRRRGMFVKLPAIDVIDLLAAAGFDFAVVDLEHSQLDESSALRL